MLLILLKINLPAYAVWNTHKDGSTLFFWILNTKNAKCSQMLAEYFIMLVLINRKQFKTIFAGKISWTRVGQLLHKSSQQFQCYTLHCLVSLKEVLLNTYSSLREPVKITLSHSFLKQSESTAWLQLCQGWMNTQVKMSVFDYCSLHCFLMLYIV